MADHVALFQTDQPVNLVIPVLRAEYERLNILGAENLFSDINQL